MLYLDLWCMILCSISVLVVNVIFIDHYHGLTLLPYMCDALFICCVFACVWDARGWFFFTHSGENGNVTILLHRCVCHVCMYICLYARVVLWYGVSTPPSFIGLSMPYMSDGSGGDSCWTLSWPAVTLVWVLSIGCLSHLADMRIIVFGLVICESSFDHSSFACFHLFLWLVNWMDDAILCWCN